MSSDFSVVAIIAAYNEADIIEHVVSDLINQGISVYFLDDGSTDGTVACVEPYLGRGVLAIEHLADTIKHSDPRHFEWEQILLRKTQLATELDGSWFIHHDADEFRESPWPHLSLRDAIRQVDALGFNAIDFAGLDFWPVHDGFRAGDDVREAFTYYSEPGAYDRLQIRAWKKTSDLDLAATAGHEARFAGRRVFPLRFILRHYPIRGQAHGERKIFQERKHRFLERERDRGWHVQYDEAHEGTSFIRDPSTLTPYDPDAVRLAVTLRHRDIDALRAELDVHRGELESCRETLGQTRTERDGLLTDASALRRDLEEQSTELRITREDLEKRTLDLQGHEVEIGRLGAALEQRAAEIERWRAVVDDATRRRDAFERSMSWRWTAPVRAVYRMLRGR